MSIYVASILISGYNDGRLLRASIVMSATHADGSKEEIQVPLADLEGTDFEGPEDMIRYVVPQMVEKL